ncbi:major capsid protein [uncultured Caudovirales phage]|uniref:Major capsid protein n=1 Tax=uncultured Caudovirales phage TaxID=2100421 RepID=A0A6J5M7V1_9CAUD|nr:major capsid protein [uncultured Caudovirales phage]
MSYLAEEVQNKWKPILEHQDLPEIKDAHKRAVTAQILENTEKAVAEARAAMSGGFLGEAAPTNATGNAIDNFDPVLISLVRRAMPNLIAYDICGVQPMTGPTGLIFAMRARYDDQVGTETFYNEVDTGHSARGGANASAVAAGYATSNSVGGYDATLGTSPSANTNATNDLYNFAGGIKTSLAEGLGSTTTSIFPEMAFSIEKVSVEAKSRALKAEYSLELAQDLKAIHGLDAETELSNILSAEILAEINREVIRTIVVTARRGAAEGTTTAGVFDLDTDSNGRWSVEKFKGLMFQVEREANAIAKATRRGKGNIIICSSDVASALQMAGVLDYAPALNSNNLNVDDTGNTFAGVLNGRLRVYIDPYAGSNYMVVGYKGSSAFDAGLFYCPYVPLQMVRAVNPDTFQPKIGFKTRYGMVANPFAEGSSDTALGRLAEDTNVYYRRLLVNNLM